MEDGDVPIFAITKLKDGIGVQVSRGLGLLGAGLVADGRVRESDGPGEEVRMDPERGLDVFNADVGDGIIRDVEKLVLAKGEEAGVGARYPVPRSEVLLVRGVGEGRRVVD